MIRDFCKALYVVPRDAIQFAGYQVMHQSLLAEDMLMPFSPLPTEIPSFSTGLTMNSAGSGRFARKTFTHFKTG